MYLKVHVDPKKNPIDSRMFLGIINELTEIHNAIVNYDLFVAGTQLGRLQGDLVFLMEQIEEAEKKEFAKGIANG